MNSQTRAWGWVFICNYACSYRNGSALWDIRNKSSEPKLDLLHPIVYER